MGFFEQRRFQNEGDRMVWIKKKMQTELAKRRFGEEVEVHLPEWIEENSSKFAEIFERKYNANPEFLAEYETNPNKILDEIEDEMGLLHEA
jgi:hypothetical protein